MQKFKSYLINLLLLTTPFNYSIIAQKVEPVWTRFHMDKEYGSRLGVYSSVNDSNGNTYLLGHTAIEPYNYDIFLLGLNTNGDTLFYKTYDNNFYPGSRDIAHKIHMDSSGNLVVIGLTQWNDNIYGDPLILKYSTKGELLWSTIHRPQEEIFSQNNLSVVGKNDTIYLINHDGYGKYYLEKISPEGQYINSLPLKNDMQGNYFVDASSEQFYIFDSNRIKKLDFRGNIIWDFNTLFKYKIQLSGIITDAYQNCYLYGGGVYNNDGIYFYHVIKLSSTGNVLWEKKIKSSAYRSVCCKAIIDTDGGITIAYQNNTQALIGGIDIINFNTSGDQFKEYNLTLSPEEGKWKEFENICYDNNGNLCYAVLNCSEHPNYNTSVKKLEIGMYSSQGDLIWNKKFEETPGISLTHPFILTSDQQNNLKFICNKEFSRNSKLKYTTDEESMYLSFSETGDIISNNQLQGESFSNITAHSISRNSNDYYTVVCESNLCQAESKIIAIKYDSDGNKIWEYNYLHPDKLSLKHVRTYNLTNGFVKILLEARGTVDGLNIDKHIVITLDNEGNEHLKTELDIPYYKFSSSGSYNNHYYIEYWKNNTPYLTCFNAKDETIWIKGLNDDSFINNASIKGVDKNDNLYLYTSGNLSKVDTTGNILWTTTLGDIKHINGNVVLDNEGNVYYYRNEEKNYQYKQLGLFKLSEKGDLQWEFKSDTIAGGHIVWPRPDGGISVFGQLMSNVYGDSNGLSTMLSISKDGVYENRMDLRVYSYDTKPVINGENLFIIHQDGILLFDKNGKYLSNANFDKLSFATLKLRTKDLTFDNAQNAISLNEISVSGYSSIQDWKILALSKFDIQAFLNHENSAPYFVNVVDTVNNTNYYENYINKAVDNEGDPVLYTLVSDDSNRYAVNASIGNITNRYSSAPPQRGIHNLVIRASDPHGAYSDQKRVIVIGPDNMPFFVSKPITTCRVGSKYVYNPIVIDDNNDPLNYSLINNNTNWLSIDENTGKLSGIPPENTQNSTISITIGVYEETFNHNIQQNFNLLIEEQNTPPTINDINTNAILNKEYKQELSFTDAENDDCEWTVLQKPDWLIFDTKNNIIYGTPTKSDFYKDRILKIQLTDSYLGTTIKTFNIYIENPDNLAPVFISKPLEQAYSNLEYYYILHAYDPDGNEISYETIELPAFLSFYNDSILIGTPSDVNEGQNYPVILQATDYFGKIKLQEYILNVSSESEKPEEQPFYLEYSINSDETELEITITNIKGSTVEIDIYNNVGIKMMEHQNHNLLNGEISQSIKISSWPQGNYTIFVTVDKKQIIKKITIN